MEKGQVVEVQGERWKLLEEWMPNDWEAERLSDQVVDRIQWLNDRWQFFKKP